MDNTSPLKVETTSIKCPSCGACMSFNPNVQKLSCDHCGAQREIESFVVKEQDLRSALSKGSLWEKDAVSAFCCDNCGAKVTFEKKQTATFCPFCGTSHVKKIEEFFGVKPNGLVPFTIDDDRALECSKFWAKSRFFAPKKFKKGLKSENVKGIYAPCFTFDSETFSSYTAKIGDVRTRTVGSGKNKRTVTYVDWRIVSGTFSHKFDDVLISAGEKVSQEKVEKLSPFDTNNGKAYKDEFLLGYGAYHTDVDIADCWSMAKGRIDSLLKSKILSQYSYDRIAYFNIATSHANVTYKYVMLPVYVGNFNYKNKLYNFYVNGSTGRTFGKYPKSIVKILSVAFLIGLFIIGVGCLLYNFGVI